MFKAPLSFQLQTSPTPICAALKERQVDKMGEVRTDGNQVVWSTQLCKIVSALPHREPSSKCVDKEIRIPIVTGEPTEATADRLYEAAKQLACMEKGLQGFVPSHPYIEPKAEEKKATAEVVQIPLPRASTVMPEYKCFGRCTNW